MGYLSFLEIILFAYMAWLPGREWSVALKWICGTFSIAYIAIALVWMLLFSLLLFHWCPLKVYFSVIAILSVLWIFLSAKTVKVDNINATSTQSLTDNRHRLEGVSAYAEMLLEHFNLLKSAHPGLIQSAPAVSSLCRALTTLSPTVMSDDIAVTRINTILSGLEEILDEPFSDMSAPGIQEYAEKSIISLNRIKKSIRK